MTSENMRNQRIAILIFLSIFFGCFSSSAISEETPIWSSVGGWTIHVDRTLDFGCFAMASYELGSALRFGWNPIREVAYLILGDPSWKSLEVGKSYEIEIQFDNLTPWEGTATGVEMGQMVFLWVDIDDANFIVEMAQRHALKIFYQNDEILRLSLQDSYRALQEMIECQETVNSAFEEYYRDDPFRPRSEDPFKR